MTLSRALAQQPRVSGRQPAPTPKTAWCAARSCKARWQFFVRVLDDILGAVRWKQLP